MLGELISGILQRIKTKIEKLTFDTSSNLLVGINADNIGLAKETTLSTINNTVSSINTTVGSIEKISYKSYFKEYVWDSTNNTFTIIEGYIDSVNYTYDTNGNVTEISLSIVDSSGNAVATVKKTMTYDTNGNLTSISKWVKV